MKSDILKLIPQPQKCVEENGFLKNRKVKISFDNIDNRIRNVLKKLPIGKDGIELKIEVRDTDEESYELKIRENQILINADGIRGAFYAVQTLRQIFENDVIPYCTISDKPDFKYRGIYLDITRGKVPKLETIKKIIDKIAYMKINSLQLYVEHTYEFKEYTDSIGRTGYITAEELQELDAYCKDNFIDFIPSIATFGHLYELLSKDRYRHLCVLDDFKQERHLWNERLQHHTIDPLNPESIELIKSLIDQYSPNFTSEWFNICCDETFDLKNGKHKDKNTGELYINFVQEILEHLGKKGKKVMMWGDVLRDHPDQIDKLPKDVLLLNWYYRPNPARERVSSFHDAGRKQILTTSTWTFYNFTENLNLSLPNITDMSSLGYEYKVEGILNSIWGDYGHTASIELTECGVAYGADRSWNVKADVNAIWGKLDKVCLAI